MMRIAIFPADHDGVASARIRAYTLQRSLCALGNDARLRDARGAEVLFIQKIATPQTLAVVERASDEGALTIYDVDDLHPAIWYSIAPSVLHRLLRLVDLVTTDTTAHRKELLRAYGPQSVEIVPDTIDYYPVGPVRPRLADDGGPLRVLWFGHAANIALFEKYARALGSVPGIEVVAVTSAASIARLSAHFPSLSFLPWSRDTFVPVLQSCALTVLSHDGSEIDRAKSNNRMITSITWGVPAVVSRTPEYERTTAEAGVESAMFSDEGELVAAVERLRSAAARSAYLDAAQPEIWRRYSPAAVAGKFLEIVGAADRRQPHPAPLGYLRWLRRASHGHMASALIREPMHLACRWIRGSPAAENPS